MFILAWEVFLYPSALKFIYSVPRNNVSTSYQLWQNSGHRETLRSLLHLRTWRHLHEPSKGSYISQCCLESAYLSSDHGNLIINPAACSITACLASVSVLTLQLKAEVQSGALRFVLTVISSATVKDVWRHRALRLVLIIFRIDRLQRTSTNLLIRYD